MAKLNVKMNDGLTMAGENATYKRPDKDIRAFRTSILDWYDTHARVLPWRARPYEQPDPYHVWLSEVMLQQTVVAAVIPYFQKFVDKWPTVTDLANAHNDEVMTAWAGLGYYARARNLHKCAQVVAFERNGKFPDTQKDLKALPGIGDYTSAAITSIAFNKQSTVVDGNIERVISRLYAITTPLPESKPQIKAFAETLSDCGNDDRPGDYAQALMDIGAGVCIPKSPRCGICPVSEYCKGRKQRIAAELPYKIKKAPKPTRHGYIYLARNSKGDILLERRPETGLLGGMLAFPTSEWVDDTLAISHPQHFDNAVSMGKNMAVNHVFTHFTLNLKGFSVDLHEKITNSSDHYVWVSSGDILDAGLPTLFKKFAKLVIKNET